MNLCFTLIWDTMSRNGQRQGYVVAWVCTATPLLQEKSPLAAQLKTPFGDSCYILIYQSCKQIRWVTLFGGKEEWWNRMAELRNTRNILKHGMREKSLFFPVGSFCFIPAAALGNQNLYNSCRVFELQSAFGRGEQVRDTSGDGL